MNGPPAPRGSGSDRALDAGKVGAVLEVLLRDGKPIFATDPSAGEEVPVSPQLAAAAQGFLPLLLAAGDAVWREATGRRLGIELRLDPDAVLGFRAARIAPGPAAPVLLSVMEAIAQAERPEMLVLDDLRTGWAAAQERMRRTAAAAQAPATPAASARQPFPSAPKSDTPPGGPRP